MKKTSRGASVTWVKTLGILVVLLVLGLIVAIKNGLNVSDAVTNIDNAIQGTTSNEAVGNATASNEAFYVSYNGQTYSSNTTLSLNNSNAERIDISTAGATNGYDVQILPIEDDEIMYTLNGVIKTTYSLTNAQVKDMFEFEKFDTYFTIKTNKTLYDLIFCNYNETDEIQVPNEQSINYHSYPYFKFVISSGEDSFVIKFTTAEGTPTAVGTKTIYIASNENLTSVYYKPKTEYNNFPDTKPLTNTGKKCIGGSGAEYLSNVYSVTLNADDVCMIYKTTSFDNTVSGWQDVEAGNLYNSGINGFTVLETRASRLEEASSTTRKLYFLNKINDGTTIADFTVNYWRYPDIETTLLPYNTYNGQKYADRVVASYSNAGQTFKLYELYIPTGSNVSISGTSSSGDDISIATTVGTRERYLTANLLAIVDSTTETISNSTYNYTLNSMVLFDILNP